MGNSARGGEGESSVSLFSLPVVASSAASSECVCARSETLCPLACLTLRSPCLSKPLNKITIFHLSAGDVTFRNGTSTTGYEATETDSSGVGFPLDANLDLMSLLAEILSDQHVFFAGVSTTWRNAWGDLPKYTRAITPDTSVSQLQWSFVAA